MPHDEQTDSLWEGPLKAVVETNLDAVIAIDQQGSIVDWNRRASETFGWTRDEAIGSGLVELIIAERARGDELAKLPPNRQAGGPSERGDRMELWARRRDGSEFPIELSLCPLDRRGQTLFVAQVRDISAWREVVQRQSRRVLEARILGESAVGVAKADSFEESLQRVLDAICEEIGWPVGHVWIPSESGKQLVSSHIWHVDPSVDVTELMQTTERTRFRKGEGLPGKIWGAGQPVWISDVRSADSFPRAGSCVAAGLRCVFGFPVASAWETQAVLECFHLDPLPQDDELLGIVLRLGLQIGDLVRSRQFDHQQAKLAAIVDSSSDAIIGKELDGTITAWNFGAERIYGYTEEEAVGAPISIILPSDMESEEAEILDAVESGQRLEQFQATRRRKDGTLIPVSLTVSPIVDSRGQIVGSSSVERDISNRLRQEAELHRARREALRASHSRGEFLANVSHELRTPMNAIIGMTQIALEEELSPEVRDYVTTANEAAHSLLTLLNDILDFSKLESGTFSINREPFLISEVVDETIKTVSAQAFVKGLELACEMPANLPRVVIGDAMRLRQVLTNLLSNAIKFTEQGDVLLELETVRSWPTEVRLRFSVRDTGIGIPPEQQRRILEPFTQVDSSSTREHGGTGLGLAICSELLRLMGGRLSLTSTAGKGSTFSFRLSFDLPHDAPPEQAEGLPLERLRQLPVLVVDDNATNRRIIAQSLENWSLQPTVAEDAEQAIAVFERAIAEQSPFRLVVVDALMPGMDGYELSRRLSRDVASPPVILMVSSADRREFRGREADAQIAVYLEKPVTQSDLMHAVMTALNVHPLDLSEGSLQRDRVESFVPLSVLLAEDTPANQKVVTSLLKKRGHAVTVASNGREAVDLYKRGDFDVILMDVQMPTLDGFQATAAIRDHEKQLGKTTPIIAMTAHAMRGDRERCLEAGMDAYIAKPLDVKQLLGLIESIAEERPIAGSPGTADPAGEAPAAVLDYAGAMERLGGDAELFREFVGFYDEDSPRLLEQIAAASRAGSAAELQRFAHSLKGLAANLGANAVVEAAFALEKTGKSGSLEHADTQLARLRAAMTQLDTTLEPYRT